MKKPAVNYNIETAFLSKRLFRGAYLLFKYATPKKIANMLKIELQRKMQKTALKGYPYVVKIQPTNICDSGCVYCLRKETSSPEGRMELDKFRSIVNKVKDYALLAILHYSGEPLLNRSIYSMIEYAHKNKIATYLSSNFQHIKKSDFVKMIECGLDLLTISIDGASEETYCIHRKKGSLRVVLDNIALLSQARSRWRKKGPVINLQFIVTKYNEHEVPKIYELARYLKVDSLELKPVGTHDQAILPKNLRYIRRVYRDALWKKKRSPCWWLWSTMVVLWDGNVIPCCRALSDNAAGNAAEAEINSVYNSSEHQRLRSSFLSFDAQAGSVCSDCEICYGNILRQTL